LRSRALVVLFAPSTFQAIVTDGEGGPVLWRGLARYPAHDRALQSVAGIAA
jgi:hypothetical protein